VEKIKVGVIGCGFIAKVRHLPAFKSMNKRVDVCAVCDLNESLVRETARDFGIPNAYTSTGEMFSREELDAVDICVPPQIHAPIALEAMENGCNVIMEKPMALKTADCDAMIDAAAKHGLHVCTIHNQVFHPPFLRAKELVANGEIGQFTGMQLLLASPREEFIDMKDHWYHRLPGGIIGETGPHIAYMSMAFLGNISAVDIYARSVLKHPWAPFDEFRIELEGENGRSSAALSYTGNYWANLTDIIGTEAMLRIDTERMLVVRQSLKELSYLPIAGSALDTVFQEVGSVAANAVRAALGRNTLGTNLVIERFVESLIDGSPSPVTPEEGREAVRIMEMVVARYREKYGDRLGSQNES
jgi:predicted dehydrogenase